MAALEEHTSIAASPDAVWAIAGDVGGIATWIPAVVACRLEGDVRHVDLIDDRGTVRERIVARSDADRTYAYEFVDGDMPLATYRAEVRVTPAGAGTSVSWASVFEVDATADEDTVLDGLRVSYRGGLAALKAHAEAAA